MFDSKMNEIADAYSKGVVRSDEGFKGDLIGHSKHIRTFAILTAENPFATSLPRSANMERNDDLERGLKAGNYVFRKVIGQYGGKEHSYSVYNIPVDEAKRYAADFNQESFVFAARDGIERGPSYRGNRMEYQFWQYDDAAYREAKDEYRRMNERLSGERDEAFRRYPKFDWRLYRLVDTQRRFVKGGKDFYTRRGDFTFNIPFDFGSDGEESLSAGEEIDRLAGRMGEEEFERALDECFDPKTVGSRRYRNRVKMYGYRGEGAKRPVRGRAPDGLTPLTEASLSHILRKDKYAEGYVIVSACRGSWSGDEEENRRINNEKKRELAHDAKAAGFGYIPVFGGYVEKKGTPDEQDVFESSLMVFPRDTDGSPVPFERLKEWAVDEGIKFRQEVVLIKEPADADGNETAPYYVVTSDYLGDDGAMHRVGDRFDWFGAGTYKVNDVAQQFFTSMRKKTRRHAHDDNPRRFTLVEGVDDGFGVFVRDDPKSMSDIHGRCAAGSLFNASAYARSKSPKR